MKTLASQNARDAETYLRPRTVKSVRSVPIETSVTRRAKMSSAERNSSMAGRIGTAGRRSKV